jgi:hypothetical protein
MSIQENPQDLQALETAVKLLTDTPVMIKISNVVGSTIEAGLKALPQKGRDVIQQATQKGLNKAVELAGKTLEAKVQEASTKTHMFAAAASGAIGGFFGFAGLAVEIPATTVLMMRSILDIARSEGHDITDPKVQLECLSVFSHGSETSDADDKTDASYYASRAALAEVMTEAAKSLSKIAADRAAKNLSAKTAGKWVAQLIDAIATRFGIVITEKAALQAAPFLGAFTGATVNSLFMDFYQDTARGHFTVLRLEEKYGMEAIKNEFENVRLRLARELTR